MKFVTYKTGSPAPPPIPPKPIGMTGLATLSNSLNQKGNGNTQNLSDLNNAYNGNHIQKVPILPPKKLPLNSFDDVTYSSDIPRTSSSIKYHRLIDSYHSTSKEDGEDEQYCMLDNSIGFESKVVNKKSISDMNKENEYAQTKQTSNLAPIPPLRFSTVSHDSRMSTSSGNGGMQGNEDEGEGGFSTGTELDMSGTNSAHSILSADYYLSPEYNPMQESISSTTSHKPKIYKGVNGKVMANSASEFEMILSQELGYQSGYNGLQNCEDIITRPPEEFVNAKREQYRWSYNADLGDTGEYRYDAEENFTEIPMLRPPPIGRSDENGSSSEKETTNNEPLNANPKKVENEIQQEKDMKFVDKKKHATTCWQTRCVELEFALQKFRDQAQTIRELLREKVRITTLFFHN